MTCLLYICVLTPLEIDCLFAADISTISFLSERGMCVSQVCPHGYDHQSVIWPSIPASIEHHFPPAGSCSNLLCACGRARTHTRTQSIAARRPATPKLALWNTAENIVSHRSIEDMCDTMHVRHDVRKTSCCTYVLLIEDICSINRRHVQHGSINTKHVRRV